MRLASWPFLFLLMLLPLGWRFWLRRAAPAPLSLPLLIPLELRLRSPLRTTLGLKVAALACLIVGLSRPQNSFRQTERITSGIDIMMAMDVSASMNIEDLAERSRLEVAKDTIEQFIEARQSDRIGLVVFSGEPLTLAPPTLDYGLLNRGLRQVTTGMLKDGTAIGDGLSLAVSHLRTSRAKSRVVILLTDGDNNLGQIDPATAGDLAEGYHIRVYTIAIGREGRVKMPIRQRGILGNTVTSYQWFDNALNPELLRQIAQSTHGKFYRVTDETALTQVFAEINQLEKTDVRSREKVRYEEAFALIVGLGIVLWALSTTLERFAWRITP